MKLARYYHTARYMRPIQFTSRVWQKLNKPRPDLRPAPALRARSGAWVAPPHRAPVLLGPTTFRFLNETHEVASPADWRFPSDQKVSVYNLHYFDDLTAQDAEQRRAWHQALIERWIQENPPGEGLAWEPYPTSLRIVNWIKWALAGNTLSPAAIQSLAVQARYLTKTIEWHLLGNHVLANGKGLAFAGTFFAGPEAEAWLALGLRVLQGEFQEEILPDGGHFEHSPMYHSIILEDVLDLVSLGRAYAGTLPPAASAWPDLVGRMRVWLKTMCHPDGEIAFFNDAAWNIAPTQAELEAYARRLGFGSVAEPGEGITHLKESGFIRMQRGPAVVLLDVGDVGPAYFPGHAHADTLTFELSLFGARVIVNSGTSTYARSPERLAQRGTAAHNTVVVDEQDSSEVWASFRVARRAWPRDLRLAPAGDGIWEISCAHDGYLRLPGRALHRRTWRLAPDSLEVQDSIEGRYESAVARFHLPPDITAVLEVPGPEGGAQFQVCGHRVVWSASEAACTLEPSRFHPEFGLSEPNLCLTARLQKPKAVNRFSWQP